jgi:peptidyl-prolyl cis-trans isomerase D
MFDLVHKNKRIIQIFLGLIALTFATWGIESYTRMRGGGDTVAKVNGLEISAREFDEELRRRNDQLRQALGANYDPSQFDTPEMRRGLLESLVSQRLVASAAYSAHLTVTDEALVDAIHSIGAFKGPDGNFSKSAYETVLRQQNPPMSPAQFESRLRYDLSLAQLTRAVGEAAIPSRTVAERLGVLEAQGREISEFRISAEQFLAQAKVDDAKIKAFYDANPAQFQTPERIRAEYVVLSAQAIADQEQVKPEEVRAQWESAYGPKLRAKEAARKKAEEVAAAVRKNPGASPRWRRKNRRTRAARTPAATRLRAAAASSSPTRTRSIG